MPRPRPNEDSESFLERCVEELLDDGESNDRDELESQCELIWSQSRSAEGKAMKIVRKVHTDNSSGPDFVLSDNSVDRMGDQIEASGWQLDAFRRNNIALFNHRSDFPIGTWKNLRVEGNALVGRLVLAPEGTSERIDEIRRLCSAGVLKAVSVGFREIESKPRGNGERGLLFTKQELVEASLVSIPANANALAIAKGLDISDDVRRLVFESDSAQRERAERHAETRRRALESIARLDRKIARRKKEGFWRI
jgi:HK97 family phage prohead protease